MTPIAARFGLSLGIALVALAPLGATAQDQYSIIEPGSIKWVAAPPALPKGAQVAVLTGNPGYKLPAHTHPADENVTVLSGTLNIGMGDKLDPKKGEAVKAGGYVRMPKGMHHYAWFSQETVIQLNGVGPWELTYLNTADDPRKIN
jgi:quercetin dioxygenase-like cupin family protein